MKVASIGGGPAGLYFSILFKQAFPDADVAIYERNRADDTFGWGVVFSDETLDGFEREDPVSMERIRAEFAYWPSIETYYGDTCVTSTGHGFCGLARKTLLQILHERCRELGVALHFETDITDDEDPRVADADLILAADGINSVVREKYAEVFHPTLDWRACKFCWLGTDKPLDAFTFVFLPTEHGLFQVHAYPFEENRSTWIVECREETWRAAGLEDATEEQTVAFCSELFAPWLGDHQLLTNRSIWRTFPTVRNERWHHGKVVLVGDAAHTAHFSIGSGTKLAMEDAIALKDAFVKHGTDDVPAVLAAFEEAHYVDTIKIQKAAQTSLEWFENTARYARQHPLQFSFNLMTRSKRITYDNLKLRDPELVDRVSTWWWDEEAKAERAADGSVPPPIFAPFKLRELELANRVVVSPMCQYSAVEGLVNDWHLVHLGGLAIGGAGLVYTEATDVSPTGRITHGCAGLYTDEHVEAWTHIVEFARIHSRAALGIQLAHAGRKASCHLPWEGDDPLTDDTAWPTMGPSALPFSDGWHTPREMDRADMDQVRDEFVAAVRRAEEVGFDIVELHAAHGYLLSSFLSPESNQRTDAYGGSLENRMRWPLEVFEACRAVWPAHKPMAVRLSATDWLEEEGRGTTIEDSVAFSAALKERGCDLIDVSTAGNSPDSRPIAGRMYQVPFAERIRYEVGIPVMCVGAVQGADQANTILAAGRADLVAMARPHLVDPHLTLGASATYDYYDQWWPPQYLPAKPRPRNPNERRR